MYLIVLFEGETRTGPLAKEWFSDGLAWWPPYKDKVQILRSVQKRLVPQPLKGWKQYAARILFESDSIDKIQERWERSCATSDLNTDKEQEAPTIRKLIKPKRLRTPSPSSSSTNLSSEEDDLPLPQKQPPPPQKNQRVERAPPKALKAPPPLPLVIRPKSRQENAIRVENSQARPTAPYSCQGSAPAWQPANVDSSEFIPSSWMEELEARPMTYCHQGANISEFTTSSWMQELARPATYCHQGPTLSEQMEAQHPNPNAWHADGLGSCERPRSRLQNTNLLIPPNCTAVERLLLEQLGELHLKVDHLTAVVQSLSANRAPDQQPQSKEQDLTLPISTLEELNNFEERLGQDRDFKKRVIAKLSITGGNSVKRTVWRVCGRVFTPELATQLNWCGRGQKTGIKSRPVKEMIMLSVLRNGVLPNMTEAEVEKAIQNWLRLSQDRVGGRQRWMEDAQL